MDGYIEVHTDSYHAAFTRDERGETIETVDFNDDGGPDWDFAGVVEPRRANDPEFSRLIAAALRVMP